MQLISLFGALALVAAVSKVGVLSYSGMFSRRPTRLVWLVLLLALCDVLLFLENDVPIARYITQETIRYMKPLLRCGALALAVAYVASVTRVRFGHLAVAGYALCGALVAYFVIVSDSGLVTASVAWLRRSYFLSGIALFALLTMQGIRSQSLVIRQRCRTVLGALTPLAALLSAHYVMVEFSGAAVIDTGIKALMPIAVSLVLVVIVLEESGQLSSLRIKLEVLCRIVFYKGPIDASALTECLEHAMVRSALRRSEYNKAEAARLLGLSKSTFHRKAAKYRSKKRGEPECVDHPEAF